MQAMALAIQCSVSREIHSGRTRRKVQIGPRGPRGQVFGVSELTPYPSGTSPPPKDVQAPHSQTRPASVTTSETSRQRFQNLKKEPDSTKPIADSLPLFYFRVKMKREKEVILPTL